MRALFDRFYDTYHQDIYNFVFYMVKDKGLTEDLVQEVYIRVIRSYHRFRGESSEKTWAFSIARNVVFDHFRKVRRTRNVIQEGVELEKKVQLLPVNQDLPEEILIQNEDVKQIYRLLDRCTVNQKEVIILRYIQGCSLKETAEIMGKTISNIKTLQHRGINRLKMLVQAEEREGGMDREEK